MIVLRETMELMVVDYIAPIFANEVSIVMHVPVRAVYYLLRWT